MFCGVTDVLLHFNGDISMQNENQEHARLACLGNFFYLISFILPLSEL